MKALGVSCPKCGAHVHQRCVAGFTNGIGWRYEEQPHAERIEVANK